MRLKLALLAALGISPMARGGRPERDKKNHLSGSQQPMQRDFLSVVQALKGQVKDLADRVRRSEEMVMSMFPPASSLHQLGESPVEPRHVKHSAAANIAGSWAQRGGYTINVRQNGSRVLLESSAFPQGRASGVLRPLQPGGGRRHTVAWLQLGGAAGVRLGHRARVLPNAIVFEGGQKAFLRAGHGHGTSPSSSLAQAPTVKSAIKVSCEEAFQKLRAASQDADNYSKLEQHYHRKCIASVLQDVVAKDGGLVPTSESNSLVPTSTVDAKSLALIETQQRSRHHRSGGSAGGWRAVGDLSGLWSEGWVGHADGQHLVVHQQREQVVLSGGGLPEGQLVGNLGAASRSGHALLKLQSPASEAGSCIRLSGKRMIFEDSGKVFTRAAGVESSMLQGNVSSDPEKSSTLPGNEILPQLEGTEIPLATAAGSTSDAEIEGWPGKPGKFSDLATCTSLDQNLCSAISLSPQAFAKLRECEPKVEAGRLFTSLGDGLVDATAPGYLQTMDHEFLVIISGIVEGKDALAAVAALVKDEGPLVTHMKGDKGSLLLRFYGVYRISLPNPSSKEGKDGDAGKDFVVALMRHPEFETAQSGKTNSLKACEWESASPLTPATCSSLKRDLAFLGSRGVTDSQIANFKLWAVAKVATATCPGGGVVDKVDGNLWWGIPRDHWLIGGAVVLVVFGLLFLACACGPSEKTLPAEKPPPGRFADPSVPPVSGMQVHASPFGLPDAGRWMPPPVVPMMQGMSVPAFRPVQQHQQLQPGMMFMQPGMAMQGDGMAYAVATGAGAGMDMGTGMLVTGGVGHGMDVGMGMPITGGAGLGMDVGMGVPATGGPGLGMLSADATAAAGSGQDYSTDFAQPTAPATERELNRHGGPPPGSI